MNQTDAYGYTYDPKHGRCVLRINGRVAIPLLSGHSPTMRETPHLVHGEEVTTGGISFDYLNIDPRTTLVSLESMSDEDWPDLPTFKRAVRGAHECLMSHYNEEGDHMHMETHGEREARRKSERDHLLFTDSQTESGPTVNVITTNGASYHTIEGVPVRINGLAFVYDDGSHVPDSTWTRAELNRFVRTAKDNRKRMNLTH